MTQKEVVKLPELLKKTVITAHQIGLSPDWGLNLWPPRYDVGIFNTVQWGWVYNKAQWAIVRTLDFHLGSTDLGYGHGDHQSTVFSWFFSLAWRKFSCIVN